MRTLLTAALCALVVSACGSDAEPAQQPPPSPVADAPDVGTAPEPDTPTAVEDEGRTKPPVDTSAPQDPGPTADPDEGPPPADTPATVDVPAPEDIAAQDAGAPVDSTAEPDVPAPPVDSDAPEDVLAVDAGPPAPDVADAVFPPEICIGVSPPSSAWSAAPGPILPPETEVEPPCPDTAGGCLGAAPPAFALNDKQPQSCGYGGNYGLEVYTGKVTLVALFAAW